MSTNNYLSLGFEHNRSQLIFREPQENGVIEFQGDSTKEHYERFCDLRFFANTFFSSLPMTKELETEIKQLINKAETDAKALMTLAKVCKSFEKIKAWCLMELTIVALEKRFYGNWYEDIKFASLSSSEKILFLVKKWWNGSAQITNTKAPNTAEVHSIATLNVTASKFKLWVQEQRNVIATLESMDCTSCNHLRAIQLSLEADSKMNIFSKVNILAKAKILRTLSERVK